MTKLQSRGQATKVAVTKLAVLFSLTYMVSYITRINYGAIIAEMEGSLAISKSLLSMAVTGSFIFYGAGQIISGICGDRFSPKKLVTLGLAVSVCMNLLIPVCRDPYQMLAVWCINGFAQAFLWPPLVKLMTLLLTEEDYKKTSVKVSWGSSFGTIVVYLLSPLIISAFGWKWVFVFSALCGFAMIFVWNLFVPEPKSLPNVGDLPDPAPATARRSAWRYRTLFTPLMLGVMLAIVFQGMLRDGVTTWMPSYISETYRLSTGVSILTGVLLPIFSILCFQLASLTYRKKFNNPMLCAGLIFGAGTLSAIALFLLTGQGAVWSVLFSAMLTGCMHGVNLILICMIPPFFGKQGNVSTVSGVLNSCTYIGSAVSTYGIALLSEHFDWKYTLLAWLLIAAAGTALCLLTVKPWKRRFQEEE